MTINELIRDSHDRAKAKGWYDNGERNIGEMLCLIHAEVSEALEEARIKSFSPENNYTYYMSDENDVIKPEGFGIEIADVVIRIADLCGYLNLDLERALTEKQDYNEKRTHRHGGKVF